jgi:acyl-CoA synthetase (AMP-forming)/AMP-acid ligase II
MEVLVELGVSTGERAETGPLVVSAGMPHRAMTERILEVADGAGYRAALIDAASGTVTAWPRFARTVRAAAHGLGRRGLAEGDTAGVFVQDAASAAVAVNAIRAAGATACVIRLDACPADIAGQLNACGARLLITSAPLAELAAEGADRSRVRQIIAFGEAAGTTSFSSLLDPGHADIAGESGRAEGNGPADGHEPGPDRELTHRDVVIAAPPCGDGQAYTSLLDLTLLTGATLVAAPLPLITAAMRVYKGTAAIVPRGTQVPGIPPARLFLVALPTAPAPVARSPWPWRARGGGRRPDDLSPRHPRPARG